MSSYFSTLSSGEMAVLISKAEASVCFAAPGKRSAKALDDVFAEYEHIALFQLGDFITIDEDGSPKYDLSKCTKDQMSLMHVEENTRRIIKPKKKKASDDAGYDLDSVADDGIDAEIVTFTVKPPDRLKALEKLGMHLGMGDKTANQTTDRLADAIRAISERGSKMPMRKLKYPKK